MDEEYVQEHILTDGIVAPLEAPRRLIHGRLQPFRSALSRRTRHISSGLAVFVLLLRVAAAPSTPLIEGAHWPRAWGCDIRVRWVKPAIETRPAARLRIVERYAY